MQGVLRDALENIYIFPIATAVEQPQYRGFVQGGHLVYRSLILVQDYDPCNTLQKLQSEDTSYS